MPIVYGLVVALIVTPAVATIIAWRMMVWMPGRSHRRDLPPLMEEETAFETEMRQNLQMLAGEIGERNITHRYNKLVAAVDFIETTLKVSGYEVRRHEYPAKGKSVWNLEVELLGKKYPDEVLIVGAHYDTVPGSPGANDNGSAVVATLALANALRRQEMERTLRFVFFANEESPYHMTDEMGSLQYARKCHGLGEKIAGMICLETIGCYLDEPNTQHYPVRLLEKLYPTTGNFIAVIGNVNSRKLVRRIVEEMREFAFPCEGMAAPNFLKDIFRSDHAAFWKFGYPAVMLTDTANFRYPHYHTAQDTPEQINYDRLARVVRALESTLTEIAGVPRQ